MFPVSFDRFTNDTFHLQELLACPSRVVLGRWVVFQCTAEYSCATSAFVLRMEPNAAVTGESPRARSPKATHSIEQRSDRTVRTLVSIQSLDMLLR